jgi:hypothetical protein
VEYDGAQDYEAADGEEEVASGDSGEYGEQDEEKGAESAGTEPAELRAVAPGEMGEGE